MALGKVTFALLLHKQCVTGLRAELGLVTFGDKPEVAFPPFLFVIAGTGWRLWALAVMLLVCLLSLYTLMATAAAVRLQMRRRRDFNHADFSCCSL